MPGGECFHRPLARGRQSVLTVNVAACRHQAPTRPGQIKPFSHAAITGGGGRSAMRLPSARAMPMNNHRQHEHRPMPVVGTAFRWLPKLTMAEPGTHVLPSR